MSEYIPKKHRTIWVLFPRDLPEHFDAAYCQWFESEQEALSYLGHLVILGKIPGAGPIPLERTSKKDGRVRICFDLNNGHRGAARYLWFLRTENGECRLIEERKSIKHPTKLSKPFYFTEVSPF